MLPTYSDPPTPHSGTPGSCGPCPAQEGLQEARVAPTPQACPRGEQHTLHARDLASVPRLGSRRPPRLLEMERRCLRAPGCSGGGAPWVGAPARTAGHEAAVCAPAWHPECGGGWLRVPGPSGLSRFLRINWGLKRLAGVFVPLTLTQEGGIRGRCDMCTMGTSREGGI